MGTVINRGVLQSPFLGSNTESGHHKKYPWLNTYHLPCARHCAACLPGIVSSSFTTSEYPHHVCENPGAEGLSNLIRHATTFGAYGNLDLP